MALISRAFVGKQVPVNLGGSRIAFSGNTPSTQNDESYLRYYKQISWLRAATSVIANGVAQTTWRLYKTHKDGEREEITCQHELKDLWNHPNPFQTSHDFLFLHQIYDELMGKNFWVKQKNLGSKELWLMPPQYMAPIPDPVEYIAGYKYSRGAAEKTFKPEQVIYFVDPDPLDPMNGVGRAQSVGIDIENISFMSQWNRNFFYRNADPGTTITYPIEASITPDDIDRLLEQWNAGHRGYGRAFAAAVLTQGAKVERTGIGQRDMDFTGLATYNQKAVLGVFGVSYSMIGGTDNVIRANAEAQLFNFARWVLTPRLIRIREKINMSLVPDFGSDLEMDYDDPAPENEEANTNKATKIWQSGLGKLNECRAMVGLDPEETEAGDQYYKPPTPSINFGGQQTPDNADGADQGDKSLVDALKLAAMGQSGIRKLSVSDVEAEALCKARAKHAQSFEPKAIANLRSMFEGQKAEALANLKKVVSRTDKLIDLAKAKQSYSEAMKVVLSALLDESIKNGADLVRPKNPHKAFSLTDFALSWLQTRIEWAANEVGQETESKLSDILSAGFEQGQGTEEMARAIVETFDGYFSAVRSERIARTETLAAANIGTIEGYKQAGVEKIRIWAAEDERTCPLCNTLHDSVHDIGEGFTPPFHVNCRCTSLAEFD